MATSTEPDAPAAEPATKHLVLRSVKLPAMLAAATLILALAVFGIIAWRGMQHLDPLDQHLTALTHLQQTGLQLEELTLRDPKRNDVPQQSLDALRREIADIIATNSFLGSDSLPQLAAAQAALGDLGNDPRQTLLATVEKIRKVLAAEVLAHGRLLADVRHDLALEFSVAGAAVLVLSGFVVLTLIRIRGRVFGPLVTLEQLLSLLAKRDYSLAPTEGVDPIVQPLTASYNHLVNRLIELEEENARHRNALEHEVRAATEALLEQHRNLAAAERLAAAGEVAARIAHELRNPFAGMQMALSNIRSECEEQTDVAQRLDLVIDELRRVTGLLNGLLDQSRTTPEPAVDFPVADVVGDLLAVLRYQIPKQITLRKEIPDDLVCHLPRDRLRQVLLNLILNSAQAIGERSGEILVRGALADDALELTISDDGPGFPEELLSEGIGPFRTGRPGGTGLGLSIVSRLVRNLEGRLALSNLEPGGACVRLTLPCRGSHAG